MNNLTYNKAVNSLKDVKIAISKIPSSVFMNAMSVNEALKAMADEINRAVTDMENSFDVYDQNFEDITNYVNDFKTEITSAFNVFAQKCDNQIQAMQNDIKEFKEWVIAENERFQQEITKIVNDFIANMEQKFSELEGKFVSLEAEFNKLRQEFEAFKQEILDLLNGLQTEWDEYKQYLITYIDGAIDLIIESINNRLEEIVNKLLPGVLAGLAGRGLIWNERAQQYEADLGQGLAFVGNKITNIGGSGGTGGKTLVAGDGVTLTDNEGGTAQTIGLNLDEQYFQYTEPDKKVTLKNPSGGGDTIVAGEGIKVEGEETKTVQSAPATSQTLGGVKTGNSDETGLVVGEDGTISIKKWSPIDITKDFEFFDSNLQNVAPLWTLDGQYSPNGRQFTLYGRMSESAIESIGIPQAATITWNPDSVWEYDTRPIAGAIQTNSLIQNATFSVRIDLPGIGARNGSGEIQFSWKGKENVSKLQFKVVKADLDLDEQTPVVIAGTPIGEGGSITFENLDMKSIGFKMKDGTIVSDLQKIKNNDAYISVLGIEAQNNNCALQGGLTPRLQAKNLVDGPVSLKIKRSAFGIQTDQTLSSLININVNFQNSVWDGVKLVCQSSDNTIDNFTTNSTLQFLFPGYSGQNAGDFEITQDDGEVVGVGALGRAQSNITAGSSITLFAGRFGTVTLTLRTRTYTTTFTKTITITVRETDNVPHIKLTTNQTSIGDQALDIANPETVEIRDISKAQGIVTFWASAYPSKNYVYRQDAININVKLNNVVVWSFQIRGDTNLNNNQFAVDLTSHAVGELFTIEYNATRFEQPVNITFGKVVD